MLLCSKCTQACSQSHSSLCMSPGVRAHTLISRAGGGEGKGARNLLFQGFQATLRQVGSELLGELLGASRHCQDGGRCEMLQGGAVHNSEAQHRDVYFSDSGHCRADPRRSPASTGPMCPAPLLHPFVLHLLQGVRDSSWEPRSSLLATNSLIWVTGRSLSWLS